MTQRLMHISDQVRQHIGIADLALDDVLSERGLDSVAKVELILLLEELLGLTFDEADLTPENFDTLVSIQALVDKTLTERAKL